MKKLTLDYVKNYVKENTDSTLLSTEYNNSASKMKFLCVCGNEYISSFRAIKYEGKTMCNECSMGIQWDYEKVKKYVNENSSCRLSQDYYVNNRTNMDFICGCGNNFKTTFGAFKDKGKRQCNDCGYKITSIKQSLTNEMFRKRVFDLVGEEYTVLSEYKGDNIKVKMKHNKCGNVYLVTPGKFTGVTQRRCPKCNGGIKKSTGQFLEEVKVLGKSEYEVIGRYTNANTPTKFIHKECGHKFYMRPADFINSNQRCPACASSKGEKKIAEYLKDNNMKFVQEYRIKECKFKRALPFDFAIFKEEELLFLIEFDGEGHFKPFRFSDKKSMSEKLSTTIRNDNIKNHYCKDNNIKLIRIPYTEFENIENILSSIL